MSTFEAYSYTPYSELSVLLDSKSRMGYAQKLSAQYVLSELAEAAPSEESLLLVLIYLTSRLPRPSTELEELSLQQLMSQVESNLVDPEGNKREAGAKYVLSTVVTLLAQWLQTGKDIEIRTETEDES